MLKVVLNAKGDADTGEWLEQTFNVWSRYNTNIGCASN